MVVGDGTIVAMTMTTKKKKKIEKNIKNK